MAAEKKLLVICGTSMPIELDLRVRKPAAMKLAWYFISLALAATSALVLSLIFEWSLSALDMVEGETSRALAISFMVTGIFFLFLYWHKCHYSKCTFQICKRYHSVKCCYGASIFYVEQKLFFREIKKMRQFLLLTMPQIPYRSEGVLSKGILRIGQGIPLGGTPPQRSQGLLWRMPLALEDPFGVGRN